MFVIKAASLEDLASIACNRCKEEIQTNLIFHGCFPYEEVDSKFIKTFNRVADEWQNPERPSTIFINHGEYINRHGDGKKFLVEELKRKKDSNRAFLSLIDMKDIINSNDEPIPSFLILQFHFGKEGYKNLYVTAYFRALEVAEFLPINLAEICQFIKYLKGYFPDIIEFDLTIHAGRAYYRPNFHCLRKTDLDIASASDIALAVDHKKIDKLREWLDSKINVSESVICTGGLRHLLEALEKCKDKYDKDVIYHIGEALKNMELLKDTRKSASFSPGIGEIENKITTNLEKAKEKLK